MTYDSIYRKLVFPTLQKLKGRDTLNEITRLESSQWYSRFEIESHQWSLLSQLLNKAFQSNSFYQNKYRKHGLSQDSIKSIEDFYKLPILEKNEFSSRPESLVNDTSKSKLKLSITGGSTGEPTRIFHNKKMSETTIAAVTRSRRWWGIDIGDNQAYLWGNYRMFDRSLKGRVNTVMKTWIDLTQNRRWFSAYNMSEERLISYYEKMLRYKPKLLVGYTSALYSLAMFLEQRHLSASPLGIKTIVCTSEILFDWQKDLLNKIFDCNIANEYGLVEAGILAYSCPSESMHLMEENVLVEVVDDAGNPTDEIGHIVCTKLRDHESLLLRYKTGDLGKISKKDCPCGRKLKTLETIEGRVLDMLVLPDGGYASPHLAAQLLESSPSVKKMQILQNNISEIQVYLVVDDLWSIANEQYFEYGLKRIMGDKVTIQINKVDDIESDKSGKFRWVKSQVYQEVQLRRLQHTTT